MKRTICLDFDGVCNTYIGWKGEEELYSPQPGLEQFIKAIIATDRRVAIFSTRTPERLEAWFLHWLPSLVDAIRTQDIIFPPRKPPADCYVDDRAIRFNGSFEDILPTVLNFKAYWENMTVQEAMANARNGETVKIESDGTVSIR